MDKTASAIDKPTIEFSNVADQSLFKVCFAVVTGFTLLRAKTKISGIAYSIGMYVGPWSWELFIDGVMNSQKYVDILEHQLISPITQDGYFILYQNEVAC